MGKGIKHTPVGTQLSQAEWEDDASHFLASGTSFPSSPSEGDLFYRTDQHKWYLYNGVGWTNLTTISIIRSVFTAFTVDSTLNAEKFIIKYVKNALNKNGLVVVHTTANDITAFLGEENLLKGMTPTLSNWAANPSTLENSTDEDETTVTGDGSAKNVTAYMTWDLGSSYTFDLIFSIKTQGSGSGRTATFTCQISTNGVDWTTLWTHTNTDTTVRYQQQVFERQTAQYVRLSAWSSDSSYYSKLACYEISAFKARDNAGLSSGVAKTLYVVAGKANSPDTLLLYAKKTSGSGTLYYSDIAQEVP